LGLVFGPVYSRRLGVSLGVNNLPYKVCTYSCVYCQLGRTIRLTVERRRYSDPRRVLEEVGEALEGRGPVDYVTFVPDGEPTLDLSLGEAVRLLEAELGVRVAVLTNGSLLWLPEVRRGLLEASLVSVKVDAGSEAVWRRVDRPHPSLSWGRVRRGILEFSREYGGTLISETMLVSGLNDGDGEIAETAALAAEAGPRVAYVAIPHRPPAEAWVRPPPWERVEAALEAMRRLGLDARPLHTPEPPPPPPPGVDPVEWVRDTVRVHPLPLDYVERLLAGRGRSLDEALGGGVVVVEYWGRRFLAYRPRPRGVGG